MSAWWRGPLIALILASCEPSSYPPASFVDTLRVLAVQADKPLAEPGERVHLEALVADPLGAGRPIAFAWGTCDNPGSAEIAACAAQVRSFETTSSASFDLTIPVDALDAAPPSSPIGSVGVVFAACAGTLVPAKSGDAPIGCVDAQGRSVGRDGFMWGEKRITVVVGLRNANPTIARVRVDGVIWPEGEVRTLTACDAQSASGCSSSGQHALQLDTTPASVESYLGQTEDVVGFFFTSQGELRDDYLRPDADGAMLTVVALDRPDRARLADLWFVVRDDRGGMSFTKRTARLR